MDARMPSRLARTPAGWSLVTVRALAAGELVERFEGPLWDPRWSFECRCGSAACIGLVDGYIPAPGLVGAAGQE